MRNCAELKQTPDSLKNVTLPKSYGRKAGRLLLAHVMQSYQPCQGVLYKLCAWACQLLAVLTRMPCVPGSRNLGALLQPVQALASCRPSHPEQAQPGQCCCTRDLGTNP